MRVCDVMLSFPSILIALLIAGVGRALFPNAHDTVAFGVLILSITLTGWVQYARTVRGSTLVERNKEYVQAARVTGVAPLRIMMRHVLPNVMGPVLVLATIHVATAIITEATLSFLGVGVPPTSPSLGTLIRVGNDYLFSGEWWITVFPGADAGPDRAVGEPAGRLAARCAEPAPALKRMPHDACCKSSNLVVEFPNRRGTLRALDDISFDIAPGEILGVVGESGAGKSLTGAAIIGLLEPPGRIASGQILLEGQRIDNLPYEQMRHIRGRKIGAIFQDPLTSLNPLYTIGRQLRGDHPGAPAGGRRRGAPARHRPAGRHRHPGGGRSASTTTRTSSRAACASAW